MMKRVYLVFVFCVLICVPFSVEAQRGCCSHHGGVVGCSNGRQVCADGTLSPSCTCTDYSSSYNSNSSSVSQPTYVYGCTDKSAFNYDPNATKDDGSCVAKVYGCMDKNANNYDSKANLSDGSCQYVKEKTVTEKIDRKVKYVDNDEMEQGKTKVTKAGSDGEKKVTYSTLVDEDGNVISEEVVSEEVITEPVTKEIERGTKEQSSVVGIIWLVVVVISFVYAFKHKNANLILNRIIEMDARFKRIILYVIYVILIFPPFIDLILLIIDFLKNRKGK